MKKSLKGIASILIVMLAIVGFFTVIYFIIPLFSLDENRGIPIEINTELSDSTRASEISYNLHLDLPSQIYGTELLLFRVGFDIKSELSKRSSYSSMLNKTSNVIIFNSKLDSGTLVFDFPSIISEIDYPTSKEEKDQNYILYKSISNDTNADGILSEKDNTILFISDLDGKNLVQLTPDSLDVVEYKVLNNFKNLYVVFTHSIS